MSDLLRLARPVARLRQGRLDWYRIENRDASKTEVFIYDEIGYFGLTSADFVKDLAEVKAKQLDVRLNTPGGDVFDGIAIYNALKSHPAAVNVYIDGLAASIGSVIAMAGDRVSIARNAQMMIHDGYSLAGGNAAHHRALADLLDKTSDNLADIYAQRAGGEVAAWREAMRAETWYNAGEAKQANLVDEVIGEQEQAATWDLSIFNQTPDPARHLQTDPAGSGQTPDPVDGRALAGSGTQDEPFDPALVRAAFREALR